MSRIPSTNQRNRTVAMLLGLLVLGALPVGMWWQKQQHREGAVARLLREKQASMDLVAGLAKKELACDLVDVRDTTDGMFVSGCQKHARYVLASDGAFRRDGDIESDDQAADSSGCKTTWTAPMIDAGTTTEPRAADARTAVADARARKHTVRLRVPTEAAGIRGLAKLRWGSTIDIMLEPTAPAELHEVVVPCPSPGPSAEGDAGSGNGDGGAAAPASSASMRDGRCFLPFESVTEVADCP